MYTKQNDRAWMEINLENLKHNIREFQKHMESDCKTMAVVKAEAYGYGAVEVSKCLNEMGVYDFAVATIDEAIELRDKGIQGDMLILGYTAPWRAMELCEYDLTQTLLDFDYAIELNEEMKKVDTKKKIKAHIKVDTGMHRLGIKCTEFKKIIELFGFEYLSIEGIFTHLCVADSQEQADIDFTVGQLTAFNKVLNNLEMNSIDIPKVHMFSSYGFLNYIENKNIDSKLTKCNFVRFGITMYGEETGYQDKINLNLDIKHVMTLKSRIAMIRNIDKGETVGYGRTFTSQKAMRIAVLPIGYADGLPRSLSGHNEDVLIKGRRTTVIGRICMDQMVIDITDIEDVSLNDEVIIIGRDRDEIITASEVAYKSNSISNELLSRIGMRVKKIYY